MAYVPVRTDQTEHGAVDGVDPQFAATVEASAAGFGVRTTVKGIEVFEVLDALPLNRTDIRASVEAGSASAAAVASGITAIDFTTADTLTAVEVAAAGGIPDGYEFV